MAYADYQFYTEQFLGKAISEADFARLTNRATSYIAKATRGRSITDPVLFSVKMATCAVAEAWQINEQGGDVTSQSVGPWSKTFARKPKTDEERLLEAAQLYIPEMVKAVRWV